MSHWRDRPWMVPRRRRNARQAVRWDPYPGGGRTPRSSWFDFHHVPYWRRVSVQWARQGRWIRRVRRASLERRVTG